MLSQCQNQDKTLRQFQTDEVIPYNARSKQLVAAENPATVFRYHTHRYPQIIRYHTYTHRYNNYLHTCCMGETFSLPLPFSRAFGSALCDRLRSV